MAEAQQEPPVAEMADASEDEMLRGDEMVQSTDAADLDLVAKLAALRQAQGAATKRKKERKKERNLNVKRIRRQ